MSNAKAVTKKANGEAVQIERQVPIAAQKDHYFVEQKVLHTFLIAPRGSLEADVEQPEFYSQLKKEWLSQYALVTVVNQEGTWLKTVRVYSAAPLAVQEVSTERFSGVPQSDGSMELGPNVRIRQGGPVDGIIVERRNADGSMQIVGRGVDHPEWRSEADAREWVRAASWYQQPIAPAPR